MTSTTHQLYRDNQYDDNDVESVQRRDQETAGCCCLVMLSTFVIFSVCGYYVARWTVSAVTYYYQLLSGAP